MRTLSEQTKGLLAINCAAVIFGCAALYGKLDVSPFWICAMRSGFSAITLMLIINWKKNFQFPKPYYLKILAMTGVLLALHWLSFFGSVQLSGIALATLTFATFPLFTVIIDSFHKKRKPFIQQIVASCIIILAVALLIQPKNNPTNNFGIILGLLSAATYACFWHSSKALHQHLRPTLISFYQSFTTFIIVLPFLTFASPIPQLKIEWFFLILLGVVNTALMLQLYLYALKRISAATCSGFVALEPVYAIVFSAVIFQEVITLWILLSTGLILTASFLMLKCEKFDINERASAM